MFVSKSVYLAGTMANLKGFGSGWRKKFRIWLDRHGVPAYDPCIEETREHKKYDLAKTPKNKWEKLPQPLQEEILRKDLHQIQRYTSFVVCYFTKYSTGTVTELSFALFNKVPVYIVTNRRLMGWPGTVAHAEGNKVFKTFDDLKAYLTVKLKLRRKYVKRVNKKD